MFRPMVVISNISDVKEAFAKSTDVAGRPLSRGLYSQMLFNPLYPVAGNYKHKYTKCRFET